MHRRYQEINIPIEVIRTVVEIAETGSYTQSRENDCFSASQAFSTRSKRIQSLVGGPDLRKKLRTDLRPTAKGELILSQARRILESNDQILTLGGAVENSQPVRIGLSNLYAEKLCQPATSLVGRADRALLHSL